MSKTQKKSNKSTSKPVQKQSIFKSRNFLMLFIMLMGSIVSAGFFPILNFNKEAPAVRSTLMTLLIIFMSFTAFQSIGVWEANNLSRKRLPIVAMFNISIVVLGLLIRYFLEYGEISNVYNFTAVNITFHLVMLAGISTAMFAFGKYSKRKQTK